MLAAALISLPLAGCQTYATAVENSSNEPLLVTVDFKDGRQVSSVMKPGLRWMMYERVDEIHAVDFASEAKACRLLLDGENRPDSVKGLEVIVLPACGGGERH